MLFNSIIITGTSCSGKSTIANLLCKEDEKFTIVKAVTTRDKRDGDINYEYISEHGFNSLMEKHLLLTSTTYRRKHYGIKREDYESVLKSQKIPILIISSESAHNLLKESNNFMCFFIDESDDALESRLKNREKGNSLTKESINAFLCQNKLDRQNIDESNYIIMNHDVNSSVSLIKLLWKYQNQGGGLSEGLIKAMLNCGMLLENTTEDGVNGASYDLRLGDEYYYGGQILRLSDEKPFLTIEPYDYAIVSCMEIACIPRDVIGKFGLSVGLFCRGIILSNGPQIDPGFRGTLFCLLFNTSNQPVHLKRGQHYATIEFNKLIEPALPYNGSYQGKRKIIDYIPANALYGAINELKKDIEKLKNESKLMQNIYLGVVALMFTIISILLIIK